MKTKIHLTYPAVKTATRNLAAVAVLILIGTASRAHAQCDTFDGTVLDTDKWVVTSPIVGGSVTQNDALYLTTDGVEPSHFCFAPEAFGGGPGIGMRRKLAGDFDIQVDFRDFDGAYDGATQAFFQIYQDGDFAWRGNQLHIKRLRTQDGDFLQTVASVNGVFPIQTGSPNIATSGTFRIVRIGSQITTYFNGIEDFSLEAFSGPVIVSMHIGGPGSGGSIVYDNFCINSGTLVEPPLSCEPTPTPTPACDTFDGTVVDTNKWEISSGIVGGSVTQNDALYLTTDGFEPGNWCFTPGHWGGGVGIALKRKLAGDFDIQADFGDFNGGYDVATQAFIFVYQDALNQGGIKRLRTYVGDFVQSGFLVGGSATEFGSPNVATFGTFRIVRTGSLITTYFDGVEDLSVLGFTGDVIVTMSIGGPGQPGSVAYDNFCINSGTLVEPPLSCGNQPPLATDDFYGLSEAGSLGVAAPGVLANDNDADNNPLIAALVTGPTHATSFQLNQDGSFNYTPLPYFYGEDTFTYRANDGTDSSEIATVHITVSQPGSAGFITGGGNFFQDGRKCTFGFVAKVQSNGVQGNLEFQDRDANKDVKSQVMQVVYAANSIDGYFGGTCRVNGAAGYTFFVQIHDRGEPGRNDDLTIWIFDSSNNLSYTAGALLSGGNIVIHEHVVSPSPTPTPTTTPTPTATPTPSLREWWCDDDRDGAYMDYGLSETPPPNHLGCTDIPQSYIDYCDTDPNATSPCDP